MKSLRLIPDFYRQQPIVKAAFAYDKELISLFEWQKEARWIQTPLGHNGLKTSEQYTQVSTQETGNIINPLDTFSNLLSGTITNVMGNIEPLLQRDKKNRRHKGEHTP